jgi:hypothetical protein
MIKKLLYNIGIAFALMVFGIGSVLGAILPALHMLVAGYTGFALLWVMLFGGVFIGTVITLAEWDAKR